MQLVSDNDSQFLVCAPKTSPPALSYFDKFVVHVCKHVRVTVYGWLVVDDMLSFRVALCQAYG